jgi:SSS family solute:Na+ symporter
MSVAIVISVLIALYLPNFYGKEGSAIIAIGTAIFFGLCAAAFLPIFFGAVYLKNMTKTAAISSFVCGALTSVFWLAFVHLKESAPLKVCKFIFGVDSLAMGAEGPSKLAFVDPLIIALPVSIIVMFAVIFFTKKMDEKHVAKCFDGVA